MRLSLLILMIILGVVLVTVSCGTLPLLTGSVVAECEALERDSSRDTCYAELGILRTDLNLCDKAFSEASKFYCYESIAEKTKAPQICAQITDNYWQPICYQKVGISLNNSALCAEVAKEDLRNDCFYEVALSTFDEKVCPSIADGILHVKCMTRIAVAKNNVNICFGLGRGTMNNDRCIFNVAKKVGNPTMCNWMSFDEFKKTCFDVVEEIAAERRAAQSSINSSSV